jgi:hypothetical protein
MCGVLIVPGVVIIDRDQQAPANLSRGAGDPLMGDPLMGDPLMGDRWLG